MCGTGESNKLGVGDTRDRETPECVESLRDVPVVHVACGKYHTAVISESGDVYAWGLESSGQLGLGSSRTKAITPQKVEALCGLGVTQLSCGMYHTLALTDKGEVYSFGFGGSWFNGSGGLGLGGYTQQDAPVKLDAFGPADVASEGVAAASVSAGGYHSVVRDTEGGVWTFGRGEWGRLGHGDASDCLVPTRVEAPSRALQAATQGVLVAQAGEGHTGVLGADGITYTWGRNEHWQLGYEVSGLLNSGQSFDAQQEPQAVPIGIEDIDEGFSTTNLPRASMFACGEQGSAAVLEDGSIYAWGMQRFFVPTIVPGSKEIGHEIASMQLGATHLALLTHSGKVFSFGSGTALALPKAHRKPWELTEVTAHSLQDKQVLSMACGPHSTGFIVADAV